MNKPKTVSRPDGVRKGHCFQLSAMTLFESPEGWELVHGSVIGRTGKRIGHAWLRSECGVFVYDAVLDRMFLAEDWEAAGAEEVATYFEFTAMQEILHSGHWGPWEDIPLMDVAA